MLGVRGTCNRAGLLLDLHKSRRTLHSQHEACTSSKQLKQPESLFPIQIGFMGLKTVPTAKNRKENLISLLSEGSNLQDYLPAELSLSWKSVSISKKYWLREKYNEQKRSQEAGKEPGLLPESCQTNWALFLKPN